jgi:hypothetical protein
MDGYMYNEWLIPAFYLANTHLIKRSNIQRIDCGTTTAKIHNLVADD